MNILVKAVQEAIYEIPDEVLTRAFLTHKNNWRTQATTIEDAIIQKVIKKRVYVDAQITRGEHMNIKLTGVQPQFIDDYRCVYQIPTHLLQGKTILVPLSVSYTPYSPGIGSFGYAYGGVGPLFSQDTMTAAQQMVEATSAVPNVSTAKLELIGENTVLIEDAQRYNTAYHLSCYVTDADYLNKIDPRAFKYFAELCEFAIKSYIYKALRISVGRAALEGGSALGEIKAVVDEYADAEVNYRTYLRTTWAKVAFQDNSRRKYRFLKMQIPIGL